MPMVIVSVLSIIFTIVVLHTTLGAERDKHPFYRIGIATLLALGVLDAVIAYNFVRADLAPELARCHHVRHTLHADLSVTTACNQDSDAGVSVFEYNQDVP